jgi:hypothetical protein
MTQEEIDINKQIEEAEDSLNKSIKKEMEIILKRLNEVYEEILDAENDLKKRYWYIKPFIGLWFYFKTRKIKITLKFSNGKLKKNGVK